MDQEIQESQQVDQVDNVSADTTEDVQEVKVSKYEAEAREMGWRPESDWDGDPEDFVSAKEFVQRKVLYDKISTLSKGNKELREVVEKLKEHHTKIEEYTRKEVLKDLQKARKAALEEGNADALNEIDEAIIDYKLKEKEEQTKSTKPAPTPGKEEFDAWQAKNAWFGTNRPMSAFAKEIANEYVKEYGKDDPMAVLRHVEAEVRKEFPEKFSSPNKARSTSVESSSTGKVNSNESKYSLTEEEKRMGRQFVKYGAFKSLDDYAKDLAKHRKGE